MLAPFASALGPLAVVDLETTGLASDSRAEILELGAVLIDPGSLTANTIGCLVRPTRSLPLPIRRLTGLTDADVASAPRIAEVAGLFGEALAGRTLIAHNASFERRFLSRFVSSSLGEATYLDTQDVLALTHPDAPDLRLESFTRRLLGTEEHHRALDDALDTARVLAHLASGAHKGEQRYITARRALDRYAPESPWVALLGKELLFEGDVPLPAFISISPGEKQPVPFDEDSIASALADAERGARYFPGYRVRDEQIELARNFVRNFDEGGAMLLEGGTGVGKSLAYLAAAIPFAMERSAGGVHEPIVISTRTKLLQDQLLHKDIPNAARMLGYSGLRSLSIKGRANYACERRLEQVLDEGRETSLFEADRYAYAVLMACVETRSHGEVGAIPSALLRRYETLRELLRRSVAARAEQCSREECARHPRCPFGRRRAALGKAHLIVANHDLLLRWPPDYPPYTHTIVDEVHELSGVADEVYAAVVRPEEILERIDEIFGRSGAKASSDGLLSHQRREQVKSEVTTWRHEIYAALAEIGAQVSQSASDYGEVQLGENASERFADAAALAETAAQLIGEVAETAERLDRETRQEKAAEEEGEEEEGDSVIGRYAADLRSASRHLRMAFVASAHDSVAAFEQLTSPYDHWRLVIRAVSPAEIFHEHFMQRLESFAGVSASLFVGGGAFAALGELEIEQRALLPLSELSVESPFPYSEHMRFIALKQGSLDLVPQTAAVLADLARRLGGRTLGLFTSLKRMNQVAELLSDQLRGEGIEILAPRRDQDDPAALVERFCRAKGGAVLLGARRFWQGLDIPGPDLQAVVIEKLPFEVPTELRKRREERIKEDGGDAFRRFTLGKMLLHLKQMTGRLIRSEEDRGIVVLVEGRTDRGYFRQLGRALPPGTRVHVARPDALASYLDEVGIGRSTPESPSDEMESRLR